MNYFLNYSRMKNTKNKKGFTLIELLVVITIIGILATWATTVYTSQIQKARDTTRVSDIKALQVGIEQFYQDKKEYPVWWEFYSTDKVQSYVPKLAEDPKHDQTCINSRCWYIYAVWEDNNWIDNWAYEISTAFESKWNITDKADNWSDNWNDINRLELWLRQDFLRTDIAKNKVINTLIKIAAIADLSKRIVIKKGDIFMYP